MDSNDGSVNTQTEPLVDVVETQDDADRLSPPPLLIRRNVERLLDARGFGTGPVQTHRVGDGHSNVTFRVERDGWRGVLRRPPRPPYQAKAHDMMREASIQRALAASDVEVPAILHVEKEPGTLDVPFYVMEWLDGVIVGRTVPAALDAPQDRRAIGESFVEQLARLHLVDVDRVGLRALSRGGDFARRQLHVFADLWASHRTRELPDIERVESWLRAHAPEPTDRHVLLHGDFRLPNVMFASHAPVQVLALLDWELSTLGDPMADLGYLMSTYPERPEEDSTLMVEAAAAATGGFPSRAELVDRYVDATGADVSSLSWWVVLAYWRTAVGLESFYRRAVAGTTDDPFIRALEHGVPGLATEALRAIEQGIA